MTTNNEHVKDCQFFGHLYMNVMVMRCPHREAYSLTAQVWLDDDRDDPQLLWSRRENFGPFDSLTFVTEESGRILARAMRELIDADPHPLALSGSL